MLTFEGYEIAIKSGFNGMLLEFKQGRCIEHVLQTNLKQYKEAEEIGKRLVRAAWTNEHAITAWGKSILKPLALGKYPKTIMGRITTFGQIMERFPDGVDLTYLGEYFSGTVRCFKTGIAWDYFPSDEFIPAYPYPINATQGAERIAKLKFIYA